MSRLTILGAGAWGSALAATAVRAEKMIPQAVTQEVTLWGRNTQKLEALKAEPWAQAMTLMDHLESALGTAEFLVFALPAQQVRPFFMTHAAYIPPVPVVFACKGIEISTGLLLSEVLDDLSVPNLRGFLGGPHLASEVLQGLPTAGTLAVESAVLAQEMVGLFQSPRFQVTPSTDPLGVQVAGALKNVFAVLSGLLFGAALGENARAAALTQGLSEMQRFGCALGAQESTFLTQAGLGDLMVTCLSPHSRNTRFGIALARGESPNPHSPLAEGFFTTTAALRRAQSLGIYLPLVEKLAKILESPAKAPALIPQLMEFSNDQ